MTSCAGVLVVAAVGAASAAGILSAAPNAGILILWGAGAGILWRAVRRGPDKIKISTPPPPEGLCNGSSFQVTKVGVAGIVVSHPDENRWSPVEIDRASDAS